MVKPSKKPNHLSDDESDGGYDSGNSSSSDGVHQIETRKRVLKLKQKKKVGFKSKAAPTSAQAKPMKSKFLELEADVGSASDEGEDEEREITRPAKGKN